MYKQHQAAQCISTFREFLCDATAFVTCSCRTCNPQLSLMSFQLGAPLPKLHGEASRSQNFQLWFCCDVDLRLQSIDIDTSLSQICSLLSPSAILQLSVQLPSDSRSECQA